MSGSNGWIGVDLDGTLAQYESWQGPTHIGAPVPAMVERVKRWLAEGHEVKIFTARVSGIGGENGRAQQADAMQAYAAICNWAKEHLGRIIPVTNVKDYAMIELWDDRAVQVVSNTGEPVGQSTRGLL